MFNSIYACIVKRILEIFTKISDNFQLYVSI